MSAPADVVAQIRDALTKAGVPTAAGPGDVAALVARHGAAALIRPPEVVNRLLDGLVQTVTDVYLLAPGPGDIAQFQAVWDLLLPAMDALRASSSPPITWQVAGVTYPGYLLRATNRATTKEIR